MISCQEERHPGLRPRVVSACQEASDPTRKGKKLPAGRSNSQRNALAKMFENEMGQIARQELMKAARPPTEQEKRTMRILATLDELGGGNVGDDSITFTGTQLVLPADMEGKIDEVVAFLEKYQEGQETHFNINKKYNYRPYDVWAAFDRAMRKVFGVGGVGKAQVSMFGIELPEYTSVPSGPNGETIQVPSGQVQFGLLEAVFMLGTARSAEFGVVGVISVEAPKKNKTKIEGFFKAVQQELTERSIYRGHAITAHPTEPQFIDLAAIDPERVIYTAEVEDQLRVNLWAPLQYTESLRKAHISLKRAVLLHGPNGTGKTLAGGLGAMLATQNGWTCIVVRAEDDPLEALNTAAMYSPSLVVVEDLDTMVSSDKDRDQVKLVLDRLDNVVAKGREVMVLFTSNYAGKLDKNVIRPGRLDAVIHVEALDDAGYERLVKALIVPELLAGDVDYVQVVAAMHYVDEKTGEPRGFLPAFAKEAIERSMRYSIMRNGGEPAQIDTKALVDACIGMAAHIKLMEAASHADDARPTIDTAIGEAVQRAVSNLAGTFAPIQEGDGIHNIFENVKVEYAKDSKS